MLLTRTRVARRVKSLTLSFQFFTPGKEKVGTMLVCPLPAEAKFLFLLVKHRHCRLPPRLLQDPETWGLTSFSLFSVCQTRVLATSYFPNLTF